MAQVASVIRPASGATGPFCVVTDVDGTVANITKGLTTLALSINQARDDQGTAVNQLGGVFRAMRISTIVETP